jgi:hypothetical protein
MEPEAHFRHYFQSVIWTIVCTLGGDLHRAVMNLFRFIRRITFRLTVTLMLTVQLLNLSVDYTDQSTSPENLALNQIDSIVELVVEHVLDHKDAIQDTEEEHSESVTSTWNITLFAFVETIELCHSLLRLKSVQISAHQCYFEAVSRQIQTPPPKG